MLVAALGVGKRKAENCQKNVAVKSDLGFGQQRNDFYSTECMSVKSELDCSMVEDPSEVTFHHCLDDQEDGYDGNQYMEKKFQKQNIWEEPEGSEVKEKQNNEDIKVERESDESELENENEEEEVEEENGNNPTPGNFGSKKFTKKLKLEVIRNFKRESHCCRNTAHHIGIVSPMLTIKFLKEDEMKKSGEKLKCQHCPKVFDRPGLRRVHEQV